MAKLYDIVSNLVWSLQQMAADTQTCFNGQYNSEQNFFNKCTQLINNPDIPFNGLGARAFANIFSVNDQRSQMLMAKTHDFYNATNNLAGQIEDLTNSYDNLNTPDYLANLYEDDYTTTDPYHWHMQILGQLRDAFVNANLYNLDRLLDPNTAQSTISSSIDGLHSELVNQIYSNGGLTGDGDYGFCSAYVQTMITNANNQFFNWAMELRSLLTGFNTEADAASQIDKPTEADLIYELNLPRYANTPVLIWQLPNGGLLIAVKGGTQQQVEQSIDQYMKDYNIPKGTPVTILGYEEGSQTAEQVIEDSLNGNQPFKVADAIMIGDNNLPQEVDGIDYINYEVTPHEDNHLSWLPTKEQLTIMTVMAIVSVATDGGADILLSGESLSGSVVKEAFVSALKDKDLAIDKMEEYAVSLGYNASNSEHLTPEEFLAQKLQNSAGFTTTNLSVSVHGQPPIPLTQYITQQLTNGNTSPDLASQGVKIYYKDGILLPDETNMDPGKLLNNAYLGSQFIPDPTGMSKLGLGVTTTPGPVSPVSSGQ
jgi:hypothetical protein